MAVSAYRLHIPVNGVAYEVVVAPEHSDGGYVAEVLDCPGCLSQGDTLTEAIGNVRDALVGWLAAQAQ